MEIIKIGGNIVDNEEVLDQFIDIFSHSTDPRILVHGGGKIATKISSSLGIETQMVEGRRVTDSETLKVVTMVYAGLINKTIVSKLQAKGINAIGLSGADANLIQSHKRQKGNIDYGFVADVDLVNGLFIKLLIENGYTPVIAPISHDKKGLLLNTNADTVASVLAVEMSKFLPTSLTYCFELPGVMKDIKDLASVIPHITSSDYENLKSLGIVVEGMIPKIDNCFDAIQKGVKEVKICHALNLNTTIGTVIQE